MSEARALTVILEAGASYDCADDSVSDCNTDYRPPLVEQLFSFRPTFNAILKKYPKVEGLSDYIRTRVEGGTSIEVLLRELASEQSLPLKKQYWQIPLYLQELMGEVSRHYVRSGGTKYDTFVREIEKSAYEAILYLTLNYDLFLDDVLLQLYGVKFDYLGDYVRERWSLIKLHGSVNWGRPLQNYHKNISNSVNLLNSLDNDLNLGEIRMLKGYQEVGRFSHSDFSYPALAVPMEGKNEFVCHQSHVDFAISFLRACSDFLVIGFSARDQHVVELLKVVPKVAKLAVVNGTASSATEAMARMASGNAGFAPDANFPKSPAQFEGGFKTFVNSGALVKFLSR